MLFLRLFYANAAVICAALSNANSNGVHFNPHRVRSVFNTSQRLLILLVSKSCCKNNVEVVEACFSVLWFSAAAGADVSLNGTRQPYSARVLSFYQLSLVVVAAAIVLVSNVKRAYFELSLFFLFLGSAQILTYFLVDLSFVCNCIEQLQLLESVCKIVSV